MENVAHIPWPDEGGLLDDARKAGRPRLLIVEPGATPPVLDGDLEDWVRAEAPPGDRVLRAEALQRRFEATRPVTPILDADGVLRVGDRWAPLPPLEARLFEVLLSRIGSVVSRRELLRAGWPDENPGRNLLDVHVLRLRRRIEPVQLAIRTVRARGYLLEPAS